MGQQPDAVLVVEIGGNEVKVIPLDQPTFILGNSPSVDIVLDNPYISRRHAQIVLENGGFHIQDLSSKNGTGINGKPVESEGRCLQNGDRIELAHGQVVLRYQQSGTTVTLSLDPPARVHEMVVDSISRDVWIQGVKLQPALSRKEFDILNLLYERRGAACSKDEIAASGWPEREGGDVSDQDIEQYVRRLRLKFEPDPSKPRHIITLRGYGYKLTDE